jgi:hypothetical protein
MFSPSGQLKRSWGAWRRTRPVSAAARHRVAADGQVFVCDREIDRIQIFSPDGEFLEQWTDTNAHHL